MAGGLDSGRVRFHPADQGALYHANPAHPDIGSVALTTLVLAVIDAAALALAFGVPIVAVRAAIMRAKARQIESLLAMQESIYDTMERLQQDGRESGADSAVAAPYLMHIS